jgi:predicted PurR-regulated permease PerM
MFSASEKSQVMAFRGIGNNGDTDIMEVIDNNIFTKKVVEAAIKIGILGTMAVLTLLIIKPFIIPLVWGIIIAVAMEPFINKFAKVLGGRRKLAVALFALLVIAALIIPAAMLISSSIEALQSFGKSLNNNTLSVPPPPPQVEGWPIIGPSISKTWALVSSNLGAALQKLEPQLKAAAGALLGSVGGGVMAIFMFIISVAIAAALLSTVEKGSVTVTKIVSRFAGDRGVEITSLATATIRGVMQGVVGVAIIQSILATIGMVVIGVPAAGLWAVLVLVCAVIQMPPILILGPIAAWVFTFEDTLPAVLFLVWVLLVSASDSFLKPLLMGRGVDAPMLVILIGALGGMMLFGIIDLFVGAVVLAISYTLFMAWVEEAQLTPSAIDTDMND